MVPHSRSSTRKYYPQHRPCYLSHQTRVSQPSNISKESKVTCITNATTLAIDRDLRQGASRKSQDTCSI